METIATEVVDEKTGGLWHVCAYRPLTTSEALEAIRCFCSQHRARPVQGQVVTIRAQIEAPSDFRFGVQKTAVSDYSGDTRQVEPG